MLSKHLFQNEACCENRQPWKSQSNINEFMVSMEAFNHARRQAFWHRVWSFITRRSTSLLSMGENQAALLARGSSYGGIRPIDLESIRGSLGRESDFDNHFFPKNDRVRERWVSIASAYRRGIGLPVVELIQVGSSYFVVDGHHRISVMRAMGVKVVDAQITVSHAYMPVQENAARLPVGVCVNCSESG